MFYLLFVIFLNFYFFLFGNLGVFFMGLDYFDKNEIRYLEF